MWLLSDSVKRSVLRLRPMLRAARAAIAIVLLSSVLQAAGAADVQMLPGPPCDENTERESVPFSEFLSYYQTPEGHFSIYYELDSQRIQDPTGTCFPMLWGEKDNAQRFVENVGALLEQVYSFYAGDYATAAFPDLGFTMPVHHISVKLYNSDTSKATSSVIKLKVSHVYVDVGDDYRFQTHTILHEMMHTLQYGAGAPRGPGDLLDWLWEGQARYANWFLGSRDEGTGEFLTYFGATPMETSFWDLSETLEMGSYHFGGRFWRFLTYNWPAAGISESDRDLATHTVTLPHSTGVASILKLRPRRGIYLLQDVLDAIAARVHSGICPEGDECFRSAVNTALGAQGSLFDFDKAYRAYAATNVKLEGPSGGNPLFGRVRGKYKSWGRISEKAVDQAQIGSYDFETSEVGDYTVLVTASAQNGFQNGTGDDDELRFALGKEAFGGWDSPDAFSGNTLHGLTATRFLRTSTLGSFTSGLPAGAHTLTVYGDETPAVKQVRVVRGDIQPVLAEEWIPLTYHGGTAPLCDPDYNFHARYTAAAALPVPAMLLANSTSRSQQVHSTVFRVDGTTQWYPQLDGTVTYKTDAPQVLEGKKGAGVPVSMRTEITGWTSPLDVDICARGKEATELHTMDSLYVYPRPSFDVFAEIHGNLHEYSTQYEVFMLDPQAGEVEISLEGATSNRFLNVIAEFPAGGRQLLSSDVWQPTATPQFSYTLSWPGLVYKRLIIGVGAYSFEPYDRALEDATLRSALPYTLRIISRYDVPPPVQYHAYLPLTVRSAP